MDDSLTYPLQAEGVWFAYRPRVWVLKDVSLAVPEGAMAMIMGPSGAGKTTLLKVLAGLVRPQKGVVRILGREVHKGMPRALRPRVGYIPQQLGLVRNLTALENVLMGALGRSPGLRVFLGIFPKQEVERARTVLELLGIGHKAHEKVFRLSGGERQRVAIARTLLQRPKVVLADEFVSDLDLPRAAEILRLMRQVTQREGMTFLMNMHEVQLVQEFGDQVFLVKDGVVRHQCSGSQVTWNLLQEVLG
ncbi:MAG: ATP-binding cassette domain-containing protein [Dehalococcoidia bacterium]|nr:ATP-binding cassette domain-containing protein [Dehalococcoidia bacterium]MDW8119383.1 ATP-binding cassette domain-containing protein [Chloroflexota bacterium]